MEWFWVFVVAHGVFGAIVIYNYFFAFRFRRFDRPLSQSRPYVSILIPARNEEKNIRRVLTACLSQNYEPKEVWVLDDDSNDKTPEIINEVKTEYPQLNTLHNSQLPPGWSGKCHACHLLSQKSKGEYVLFLDADVWIHPDTVESAIKWANEYDADLLTVFATQKFKGFGDKLVVSLLNWFLLTFLPLNLVYKTSIKSFCAASGQFMLFKKESLSRVGGYEAIKGSLVDDMDMARLFKSQKLKVIAMLDNGLVEVRMYDSLIGEL